MPNDDLEVRQILLQLCEGMADIYNKLSENARATADFLGGFRCLVLTCAELDPRFYETYNKYLGQAAKQSSPEDQLSSRIQKAEALLRELKKRGGAKIQ